MEILPNFCPAAIMMIGILGEIYLGNIFLVVFLAYVFIPVIDFLSPIEHLNLSEERKKVVEKDKRFLVPLYSVWFMDIGVLIWLLYGVSNGTIAQTPGSFFYYALCGAQYGALNAVVGHELVHRRALIHKITGTFSYFKMLYAHFFIQHVRSHHKKVATPQDASTARLGESLLDFYIRAIPAGYVEVWDLE